MGLPAGLKVNSGTGLISGTSTAAGTSMVTLSATNGAGTGNATLTLTITVAAPSLTSLSPTSSVVGSAAQTLTLIGTNFLSTSTVTYNGVGHAAMFVSSTQLTISLAAADQTTPGSYAVAVTNPGPGGGASNLLDFTVSGGSGGMASLSASKYPPAKPGAFVCQPQTSIASVARGMKIASRGGRYYGSIPQSPGLMRSGGFLGLGRNEHLLHVLGGFPIFCQIDLVRPSQFFSALIEPLHSHQRFG